MEALLAAIAATTLAAAPPSSSPSKLGRLDFKVTGSAACQARFSEGALALHSFFYEQAHESFQAAAKADPRCAMAHWGDALSYNHALWDEVDVEGGRAALARIQGEERLTPR